MGKNCYSLISLLARQIFAQPYDEWPQIFVEKMVDDYFENEYPTFSDFVLKAVQKEMSEYASKFISDPTFVNNNQRNRWVNIASKLVRDPNTKQDKEKTERVFYKLEEIKINVAGENEQDVNIHGLRIFSQLMVEILEIQTGNITITPLPNLIPLIIVNSYLLSSGNLLNPWPQLGRMEFLLERFKALGAVHNQVRIPDGYQRIGGMGLEGKLVLPETFDPPGSGQAIPVLLPGSTVINPQLLEREITVKIKPNGEFVIPPLSDRNFKLVPPEFHRQIEILQAGNFLEHIVTTPGYRAKEYVRFLKQFLITLSLDTPGKIEYEGDNIQWVWRQNVKGSVLDLFF
jgi:hypothetical protein